MKLAIPRFDFKNFQKSFKKGMYYILPDFFVDNIIKDAISKTNTIPFESFLDISLFLKKYDYNEDKNLRPNIIMVRTGGYGDVIALSAIIKFLIDYNLVDKIIFLTEKDDIVEHFSFYDNLVGRRFFIGNLSSPLNKFPFLFKNGELDQENIRYIIFEGIIEKDKKHNWYELFFKTIGINNPEKIDPKYKRPYLIDKFPFNLLNLERYILLNLSSTSYIRSFPYIDVIEKIIDFEVPIVLIYDHLNIYDKNRLKDLLLYTTDHKQKSLYQEYIHVIYHPLHLEEYLNIISNATITISVDTMVTHYREGIKKPSFNIYVAFPHWARSKYYIYSKNKTYESSCKYQPCFTHTKKKEEKCRYFYEILKSKKKNIIVGNEKIDEELLFYPPCVLEVKDQVIGDIYDFIEGSLQ